MIHPHITLWTYDKNTDYEIVVRPGSIKREFLDNTFNSHGYHCQPLTTSHLHGWEFLLPHDVEVVWDGISTSEPHHVKITKGQFFKNGKSFVDTGTANGTISFNIDAMIETDLDHYSLLMGPPNYFINGAKPMSALIRSDWYKNNSLTFCWMMTTPNKPVLFKKGMPFMFLINYPKNLLETTKFIINTMTEEKKEQIRKYNEDKQNFYKENPNFNFANMYRKGLDGINEESSKYLDKVYRPRPGDVEYGE